MRICATCFGEILVRSSYGLPNKINWIDSEKCELCNRKVKTTNAHGIDHLSELADWFNKKYKITKIETITPMGGSDYPKMVVSGIIKKCESCIHSSHPDHATGTGMTCHRKSPEINLTADMPVHALWPPVWPNDWCSEWQEKEPSK